MNKSLFTNKNHKDQHTAMRVNRIIFLISWVALKMNRQLTHNSFHRLCQFRRKRLHIFFAVDAAQKRVKKSVLLILKAVSIQNLKVQEVKISSNLALYPCLVLKRVISGIEGRLV
jgi:hypothetical protein